MYHNVKLTLLIIQNYNYFNKFINVNKNNYFEIIINKLSFRYNLYSYSNKNIISNVII